MKLLVTGHCGFIAQNFVRMYRDQHEIMGIDKLGYASDRNAISLCYASYADICDIHRCDLPTDFDVIVNFAAESHVDNSIASPEPFMTSNFMGTYQLLEFARKHSIPRFVQIGTDEVYGDLLPDDPPFSNLHEMKPSSPYSASKASADMLVLAYHRTYNMDVVITRSCNNYGPYQYKEKFIPVVITKSLNDEQIPLYGDGLNMREWIYVEDNCEGIMASVLKGKSGGIYNLGSEIETTNRELIEIILDQLDKPKSLIQYVEDRKGHDRRYFMDSSKSFEELEWKPTTPLKGGLAKTIEWFRNNQNYWEGQ